MRRVVLSLLLLLAVSCTTASRKPALETASTTDFDVRVLKTMVPEMFRTDRTSEARVILTVTNNTTESYDLDRIVLHGTGGRYYVPVTSKNVDRTLSPGETEAFNLKLMAYKPEKPDLDPMLMRTTIEAHTVANAAVREETFTQRVRPMTPSPMPRVGWVKQTSDWVSGWNYDATVRSAPDYPPIALYNPADYRP